MTASTVPARTKAGVAVLLLAGLLAGGCSVAADDEVVTLPTYEPDPAEVAALKAAADLAPCPEPDVSAHRGAALGPDSRRMPEVVLSCLGAGPALDLAALGGIPYVVNVWASWCGPCAEEMPYLQEVYEQADGRFGVLGIDFEDSQEKALLAAADFGITFPSVMDPDGVTQVPLEFAGPPTTFFVSAAGEIVATEQGQLTSAQELRDLVALHLGVVP